MKCNLPWLVLFTLAEAWYGAPFPRTSEFSALAFAMEEKQTIVRKVVRFPRKLGGSDEGHSQSHSNGNEERMTVLISIAWLSPNHGFSP